MITAIAIDDEPLALEVIKDFCCRTSEVTLINTFTRTSAAFAFLAVNPVDLLFLDINMPSISGIDFYKQVPSNVMAIFTTAYSEYATEGFNVNAIDYLLKPFDIARFQKAVAKANDYHAYMNRKTQDEQECLFVKIDQVMSKILFRDILFIEGNDNYVKVHLDDNGKYHLVRTSMKEILVQIPKYFVRVHRSYIIAVNKVTAIRNKTVYMGKAGIPVSTSYLEQVMKLFNGQDS